MLPRRLFPSICMLMAGCGADLRPGAAPQAPSADAQAAVLREIDAAARDCPWPADLARYEQTTFSAKRHAPLTPVGTVLDELTSGCSVLKFSLGDGGAVGSLDVVSESPPGWGKIAADILRLNDYAEGASSLTVFMVRISGQKLPDGNAVVSLAFRDSTVNLEIPR